MKTDQSSFGLGHMPGTPTGRQDEQPPQGRPQDGDVSRFENLLGTAVWMLIFQDGVPVVRWILTLAAGGALVAFFWRVRYHVIAAGYGWRQLSFNPLATKRVEW